ncbi:CHAT domain-containing protein [Anabaena azotica]|uniref:CHAT domain-containing protein n=1 Tax=Anabaena azotica FACHB-119 TaxID=947527 RepID=A0ABR8DDC3_9NOST|nr:CHAT domain-containing protein [Anabaena azotica]MBD2504596.1 CHAT domain-containing protein [Anabaena azotica FACHB-119]
MKKYKSSKNKNYNLIQELFFITISECQNKLQEGITLYTGNPDNPKKALRILEQSIKTLERIDESKFDINERLLFQIGYAYFLLGKYQKGIKFLHKSLTLALEIDNYDMQAAVYHCLSQSYRSIGEFRKALKYENNFLSIINNYNIEGKAGALNNLGEIYILLGEYDNAIKYLEESLDISQKNEYQVCEAAALSNLGDVYQNLGQLQTSINYYQKSLNIERKINNRRGEAASSGALGNLFYHFGKYEEAIIYYQNFLETSQIISYYNGQINALIGLGNSFFAINNYNKAFAYYDQGLKIAQKIGDYQGQADSLVGIGNFYMKCEQYNLALKLYSQYFTLTQKINDRTGESIALCNMANAYLLLNQFEEAIRYYQRSITIFQEIGDTIYKSKYLNNLGYALLQINKLEESEKILYDAIKNLEKIRSQLIKDSDKISIFETQLSPYLLLQKVLIDQNKISEALEISERSRTRAFVELLSKHLSTKSLESIQALNLELEINLPNISTIRRIAESHKAIIVEYSTFYFKEFSILYIWVIKPTGEIYFRNVDLTMLMEENIPLEEIIVEAHQRIASSSWANDAQALAQQLYQYLIQPIHNLLPTETNQLVIFVPSNQLFLVPFSALQNNSNGKFLIEEYTILTIPSIMTLNLTLQQRERLRNIYSQEKEDFINALVVGNPTMPIDKYSQPPQQLKPLFHAEEEANEIALLLKTDALTGQKAIKSHILQKMPKARLIHFATHGLLYINKLVIPGAIALAPSDNDDGLLTSSEILDLKLNAELVVLSACDTGRGIITSDGILGLSRCLFLAGVPSVILSLWEVQDSSTKVLMIEFYRNLCTGMNKAQALRQAILTVMQEYRNCPSMWAAFALSGEAE